MKNCRPVARLQILAEYKKSRPARDQGILSQVNGDKMVRCGCGAVGYHAKVIGVGMREVRHQENNLEFGSIHKSNGENLADR